MVERRTSGDIGRELGVRPAMIRAWARQYGIAVPSRGSRPPIEVERYLLDSDWLANAYLRHERNTCGLAKELGVSTGTVIRHLQSHGIAPRTRDEWREFEPSFNLSFFEQWTPEMAWVIGYAFADGCVRPRGLRFISTDRDLLETVATQVNFAGRILSRNRLAPCKTQYDLILTDRRLPEILAGYNLVPRKSLIAEMPKGIPSSCIGSFVRGVFDGDGCAFLPNPKAKPTSFRLSFASGSLQFAEGLYAAIEDASGAAGRVRPNFKNGRVGAYSVDYLRVADCLKLLALMYRNSCGIYLRRKKEKATKFLEALAVAPDNRFRWRQFKPEVQRLIVQSLAEWPTIDNPMEIAA